MQYFTKDLWIDFQEPEKSRAAHERWDLAFADYRAQLQALQPRLTATAFEFFADADVHDGVLLHFRIADYDPRTPFQWIPTSGDDKGWPSKDHPVSVELAVLEGNGTTRWTLEYAGVRRVVADFPSAIPLFHDDGDGFNDLGYHELTDAGDGFLRHEVLFSSGATLLTEFRDIVVVKADHPKPE